MLRELPLGSSRGTANYCLALTIFETNPAGWTLIGDWGAFAIAVDRTAASDPPARVWLPYLDRPREVSEELTRPFLR